MTSGHCVRGSRDLELEFVPPKREGHWPYFTKAISGTLHWSTCALHFIFIRQWHNDTSKWIVTKMLNQSCSFCRIRFLKQLTCTLLWASRKSVQHMSCIRLRTCLCESVIETTFFLKGVQYSSPKVYKTEKLESRHAGRGSKWWHKQCSSAII